MIRIKKMTATFGKLDGETLELTQGLNAITAPNEAGKSTWGAFIHAMFYGIDTGERVKKGTLPAKVKYRPWNGKPMEGVIELDWDGRAVTLQRRSGSRTPMGDFTAYDSETGETIPHLTGENCGRVLLGAESSVFCRSAFIGQNAMAVSPDAGLEQKLSSLVTTGDETVSYSQTERRLRDWKNHVRHNKTGYLPEAEGQLAVITEKLDAIRNYHKEDLELHVRHDVLTAELQKLRYVEKNLKAAEAQEKRKQLEDAQQRLAEAEQLLAQAQQAAENLPKQDALIDLSIKLAHYDAIKSIAESTQPPVPVKDEPHPIFGNMSPDEAIKQAERDSCLYNQLSQPSQWGSYVTPGWLALVFGMALLCLCMGFMDPTMLIAGGLSCVLGISLLLLRKRIQEKSAAANRILERYGFRSPLSVAADYKHNKEHSAEGYNHALEQYRSRQAEVETEEQAILETTRAFSESIYTINDVRSAIDAALQTHEKLRFAKDAAKHARRSYDAVHAAVGNVDETLTVEEDFSGRYSLPQLDRLLTQTEQMLHSIQTELAQHAGLVQALGDPAALEAEKQQLDSRIRDLKIREQAISAAMAALEEADRLQRSRFAPQIGKTAAELLCRMTGGRYDGLRMEQDMSLHAKAADEAVTRELLTLSGGTADQVYLALRLAICELALDEGVPLVLDDALVFFDDVRLEKTLDLLREMAEKRQILLFSCQGREEEYLAKERSRL